MGEGPGPRLGVQAVKRRRVIQGQVQKYPVLQFCLFGLMRPQISAVNISSPRPCIDFLGADFR